MIRVLLVDDQELVRRGLRLLLNTESTIEVVAEAASGHEALAMLSAPRPPDHAIDLALVDARMPGMSGMELVAIMLRDFPQVPALVLTTFDDDDVVLGSLRQGAQGLLLKDVSVEELVRGIGAALRGETVIDSRVAGRVVAASVVADDPAASAPVVSGSAGLTRRELEVADLVRQGASNREIAGQLFLAEGTVKNHVSAILQKCRLRDRTALALHLRGERPR